MKDTRRSAGSVDEPEDDLALMLGTAAELSEEESAGVTQRSTASDTPAEQPVTQPSEISDTVTSENLQRSLVLAERQPCGRAGCGGKLRVYTTVKKEGKIYRYYHCSTCNWKPATNKTVN